MDEKQTTSGAFSVILPDEAALKDYLQNQLVAQVDEQICKLAVDLDPEQLKECKNEWSGVYSECVIQNYVEDEGDHFRLEFGDNDCFILETTKSVQPDGSIKFAVELTHALQPENAGEAADRVDPIFQPAEPVGKPKFNLPVKGLGGSGVMNLSSQFQASGISGGLGLGASPDNARESLPVTARDSLLFSARDSLPVTMRESKLQ